MLIPIALCPTCGGKKFWIGSFSDPVAICSHCAPPAAPMVVIYWLTIEPGPRFKDEDPPEKAL